jgi:hypothetical protein
LYFAAQRPVNAQTSQAPTSAVAPKAGKSLSIMSLQIYSQIHYVYKMSINDVDKTTTNDVDKTAINYDYENPIKLV